MATPADEPPLPVVSHCDQEDCQPNFIIDSLASSNLTMQLVFLNEYYACLTTLYVGGRRRPAVSIDGEDQQRLGGIRHLLSAKDAVQTPQPPQPQRPLRQPRPQPSLVSLLHPQTRPQGACPQEAAAASLSPAPHAHPLPDELPAQPQPHELLLLPRIVVQLEHVRALRELLKHSS
eukprot:4268703-Pyramimonas_sp.AAC.1